MSSNYYVEQVRNKEKSEEDEEGEDLISLFFRTLIEKKKSKED